MVAPAPEVARERIERFTVRWGDEILYEPQARQVLLHESKAPFVLFGGAMAGGKSHSLRWHLIICCMGIPNFRALLLRREFKDLENTHLINIALEVPEELAKYNTGRKRLEFANGSILQFGHCNTDADFSAWLSTEWEIIGVDEASTFTPWMLTMLPTRLRTPKSGVKPQFVMTSNPGGEAHLWLKLRFIDKEVPPEEDRTYDPERFEFIPSKVDDNEYVNPEYAAYLDSLPEDERRADREGDWDVFAGQYFKQLRRAIHGKFSAADITGSKWFETAPKWRSYDWGWSNPASMGFWAADPDSNLYRYREVYAAQMEVEDFMAVVLDVGRDDGEFVYTVADPACWDTSHGPSVAERAALSGVEMLPSEKGKGRRRTDGWSLMRRYLDPECAPMMFVAPECRDWWRTLPTLVHDQKRVEDLDTTGEDHAADETRYFVMSRPQPRFVRKDAEAENPFFPGSPSYHAHEFLMNQKKRAKVQKPDGSRTSPRPMHPEFGEMW